jgi:hypothetical protein
MSQEVVILDLFGKHADAAASLNRLASLCTNADRLADSGMGLVEMLRGPGHPQWPDSVV